MEEVAWLFNADFEKQLFSKSFPPRLESSRFNQEFEYLIHWLDPTKNIFSHKKYSENYAKYILRKTNSHLKVVSKAKDICPWLQSYENITLLKKFQDKHLLNTYLKSQKVRQTEQEIIFCQDKLEKDYLYKLADGVSGNGHLLYPKDRAQINKVFLSGGALLKEPYFDRSYDFSTLVENAKVLTRYENYIDPFFQYKGTYIGEEISLKPEHQKELEQVEELLLSELTDYSGVFSIDSFLYSDNEFIYPACEVNMRKTMGYIAYKLKERYFSNQKHFKLLLFKNLTNKINENLSSKVIQLSAEDNYFRTYMIGASSLQEMLLLEKELSLTLL